MVARTVTKYIRAGLAACHIEDQVQTKRCGHLMGKQVVSREEFLTRIRAAVIARDSITGGSDFVIIGSTDSAQVLGMEEALIRLRLAADAGADVPPTPFVDVFNVGAAPAGADMGLRGLSPTFEEDSEDSEDSDSEDSDLFEFDSPSFARFMGPGAAAHSSH